jgi:hypothetical protein
MRFNLKIIRKHTVFLLYNDSYSSEIHERIENYSSGGGPIGVPFVKKKSDFKTFFFNFFFKEKEKDTQSSFKAKSTKHGKKKNSKGEIGNILLKHIFTSL